MFAGSQVVQLCPKQFTLTCIVFVSLDSELGFTQTSSPVEPTSPYTVGHGVEPTSPYPVEPTSPYTVGHGVEPTSPYTTVGHGFTDPWADHDDFQQSDEYPSPP